MNEKQQTVCLNLLFCASNVTLIKLYSHFPCSVARRLSFCWLFVIFCVRSK